MSTSGASRSSAPAIVIGGFLLLFAVLPSALASSPAERQAKEWEVKLQNVVFAPNSLTIQVGDTVKFTNLDAMCHTVTRGSAVAGECKGSGSKNESDFDVVLANTGDSVTITFSAEGIVQIYCKPHAPGMAMTITVQKPGTTPPPKPTPGFEALALFAALVGAAALAGVVLARKRR